LKSLISKCGNVLYKNGYILHHVPLGTQQYRRTLKCYYFQVLLLTQVWLNCLMDDHNLYNITILFFLKPLPYSQILSSDPLTIKLEIRIVRRKVPIEYMASMWVHQYSSIDENTFQVVVLFTSSVFLSHDDLKAHI
jgi:hypothetical protein